jgi:UDP-N-acetylmuramoylalanine--D-glutamate ligase
MHALEALGNQVTTLIAGGYDRGLNFSEFGQSIADSGIKTVILFPDTGKTIDEEIRKATSREINIIHINSMQEAVKEGYKFTHEGEICLMSPAAASFNLFKDYADRGNSFKRWVEYYSENGVD